MVKSWIEEATPERREVPVCLDRTLVSELEAVKERHDELHEQWKGGGMLAPDPEVVELGGRIVELETKVREKTQTLVFEGLGWGRWRDLLAKHPPADDQAEVFARAVELGFLPHSIENVGFNAETFVPAAIAATCTELTEADARRLLEVAPAKLIERLWAAVLEVNITGAADPFV